MCPISKAVQASSALPGLFPPVEIDDQYFVDGALKKTMHASVALDDGVDLMLCLNPLVPFNSTEPATARVMQRGLPSDRRGIPRIVDGGLPVVLSQTFRSMIHSRMELGMKNYERAYPDTDIVLIEPDHRDPELYLANTFSYGRRRQLAEHAYQQTRSMLRSRRTSLSAKLLRHGIRLDMDVLEDPRRHLVAAPKPPTRIGRAIASLQEVVDDLGHVVHAARARVLNMAKKAPRRTAERILEVTLDLFNRFGEPNVSTTLISAELNISPGNLYYHYPAKDELINSLFDRYERSLERAAQCERRRARRGGRVVLHAHAVRADLAVPLPVPRPERPAVEEPAAGDAFPVGAEEQDPRDQGHARRHEPLRRA